MADLFVNVNYDPSMRPDVNFPKLRISLSISRIFSKLISSGGL